MQDVLHHHVDGSVSVRRGYLDGARCASTLAGSTLTRPTRSRGRAVHGGCLAVRHLARFRQALRLRPRPSGPQPGGCGPSGAAQAGASLAWRAGRRYEVQVGRSGPPGSPSPSHVELRLAGTFRVIRDGTELAGGQIGSRKSRMLLTLLAVERPALVPVDRIVEVLWPGERPAAPEQNVATLVSRLRAALGAELIQGGRPGYRLAAGDGIVVDLDAAARFCDQAESKLATAAAVALAGAERALELLAAGTAIDDEPYADWADRAREQVRELLRRARLIAAQAALATGGPRLAMSYAEAAMAADPLDEAAHRWYMSASAAAGEQAKALAAYEALRQRLGDELGADPAPRTRELHLAILREQEGGIAGGFGRGRSGGPITVT